MSTILSHESNAPLHWSSPRPFLRAGAAGGPKRSLAALAALPSLAIPPAIGTVKHPRDSSFKAVPELPPCRNARTLLCILHWRVAFY